MPCRPIASSRATGGCARSSSARADGALRRCRGAAVDARARGPSRRRGRRPSPTASAARSASRATAGSPTRPPACAAASSCSSTTATPPPSCTTRVRRRDGTLRAYLRTRSTTTRTGHVGRQDLTAHVDVTAVERAAAAAGLAHLGTTTQAEFLAGLGAGDLLRRDAARTRRPTLEDYLTRAIRAPPDARPGGDGPLPGDGLRARLAGRDRGAATRRFRVPDARPGPDAAGRAVHRDGPGLGRSTYCRPGARTGTLRVPVGHDQSGERLANLHARSARAAPRHSQPSRPAAVRALTGHHLGRSVLGPRAARPRDRPCRHAPAARMPTRGLLARSGCGSCARARALGSATPSPRVARREFD